MIDIKELARIKNDSINKRVREMHVRTLQMFRYENLPDTIDPIHLEKLLQIGGVACVTEVRGDLYALRCGVGGELDANDLPTICTVANPWLKFDKTLKIGSECIVVRNDSESLGLDGINKRYASQLIENEITMRLMLINRRVCNCISATTDTAVKSAENFIERLTLGDIAILGDSELLGDNAINTLPYATSTGQSLIENIEYQQYTLSHWLNDLGLDSNFNMKREALNSSETTLNKDTLFPQIDNMLDERKRGIDAINALYGTNIRVFKNSSWADNEKELDNAMNGGEENDSTEIEESV